MTETTAILATIDALLATVALNPGMAAASQGDKWRGILGVLREMAVRQEAERANIKERLAALEAWRQTMTGDGK